MVHRHTFRQPLGIIKSHKGLLLGVERSLYTTTQSQQNTMEPKKEKGKPNSVQRNERHR